MTDTRTSIVYLLVRRSRWLREWVARHHAYKVAYWAKHLKEFERRFPRMRRKRGDAWTAGLMGDVLRELRATQGEDAANDARERLAAGWRHD